jgi:hypothetical protein
VLHYSIDCIGIKLAEFTFDTNNNLNVNINGSTPVVSENLASVGGSNISLGQGTLANSLPVAIASNQSAVPVSGTVTANQGTAAVQTAPWPVYGGAPATVSASWTSATATGTQLVISCLGYATVILRVASDSNVTGGGVMQLFGEITAGNGAFLPAIRHSASTGFAWTVYDSSTPALSASQIFEYTIPCSGYNDVVVSLSTAITGTGTVSLIGRAVAQTSNEVIAVVGQSDFTKLNGNIGGVGGVAVSAAGALPVGSLGPTANVVSNPAAGADFTFTVPTGIWAVKSIFGVLTTSAQVATRQVIFEIFSATGARVLRCPSHITQTASLTQDYSASDAPIVNTTTTPDQITCPMPISSNYLVAGNWVINSNSIGIQTLDQWSNISIVLERVG